MSAFLSNVTYTDALWALVSLMVLLVLAMIWLGVRR